LASRGWGHRFAHKRKNTGALFEGDLRGFLGRGLGWGGGGGFCVGGGGGGGGGGVGGEGGVWWGGGGGWWGGGGYGWGGGGGGVGGGGGGGWGVGGGWGGLWLGGVGGRVGGWWGEEGAWGGGWTVPTNGGIPMDDELGFPKKEMGRGNFLNRKKEWTQKPEVLKKGDSVWGGVDPRKHNQGKRSIGAPLLGGGERKRYS